MNVWAVPASQQAAYGLGCVGSRPHGRTTVLGHRAEWYACPEGSDNDSGHVVLVWHGGGELYGVSAHGHTRLNMRLVAFVATHLRRLPALSAPRAS
jgi:hypothetical protein